MCLRPTTTISYPQDETEIQVVLDDVGPTDISQCVENMDAIVHFDPPDIVEQIFFHAVSETLNGACFDDDGATTEMGILSAVHVN